MAAGSKGDSWFGEQPVYRTALDEKRFHAYITGEKDWVWEEGGGGVGA